MSGEKPFKTAAEKAEAVAEANREVAPEPVRDDPNPSLADTGQPQNQIDADEGQEEQERPAPKIGSEYNDKRAAIAEKFRQQREQAEEPDEYTGDHTDPVNDYGQFARKPAPQAEAEEEAPAPQVSPRIKVRGQEIELTPELIEKAQKVAAADSYLEEARATFDRSKADHRASQPRQHQGEQPGQHHEAPDDDDHEDDATQVDPELVEAVRKIQLADPEEGAAELGKIIAKAVPQAARNAAMQANFETLVNNDIEAGKSALKEFRDTNEDFASDPYTQAAVRQGFFEEYKADLKKLGVADDQLPTNETQLVDYHRILRVRGYPVRDVKTILNKVVEDVRNWRGQGQRQDEQASQQRPNRPGAPRVDLSQDRRERRNGLRPQPSATNPSGHPAAQRAPEQAQTDSRVEAVRRMRAARGQTVI